MSEVRQQIKSGNSQNLMQKKQAFQARMQSTRGQQTVSRYKTRPASRKKFASWPFVFATTLAKKHETSLIGILIDSAIKPEVIYGHMKISSCIWNCKYENQKHPHNIPNRIYYTRHDVYRPCRDKYCIKVGSRNGLGNQYYTNLRAAHRHVHA